MYLALVVAAGLLTHYFFVFTVAAALGWLWLEPQARAIRRRSTVAIAAGAVLCTPWLPLFVEQFRRDRFWWIGPFRLREAVGAPFRLFTPLVTHGLAGRVVPVAFLALTVCGAVVLAPPLAGRAALRAARVRAARARLRRRGRRASGSSRCAT